jgi:hypothetical protein
MTFYGADINQLRELAKAADKAASLLSTRASSLQSQILAAPWKGGDGERFRQEWTSSHRPSLERVVASLRQNSKILLQHAAEQEKSSAAGTGSTAAGAAGLAGMFGQLKNWAQEKLRPLVRRLSTGPICRTSWSGCPQPARRSRPNGGTACPRRTRST